MAGFADTLGIGGNGQRSVPSRAYDVQKIPTAREHDIGFGATVRKYGSLLPAKEGSVQPHDVLSALRTAASLRWVRRGLRKLNPAESFYFRPKTAPRRCWPRRRAGGSLESAGRANLGFDFVRFVNGDLRSNLRFLAGALLLD